MTKNGLGLDGVILIDKVVGISSYDVIRRLKWLLFEQYGLEGRERRKLKIGHAGTLDPFASGLLIVMIGKATKLNDTLHKLDKSYVVKAEFGYETDTQDCTGKVVRKMDRLSQLSEEQIAQECVKLIGKSLQTPPSFSAKKVAGQPAYKRARKGEDVKLEPRQIEVKSWKVSEYDWPSVEFEIDVSTGTYIRTLVVDLARRLDSMATATQLRRARIGGFNVSEAIESNSIEWLGFNEKFIKIEQVVERIEKALE